MKVIELTQGRVAILDDEDYLEYAQYRWHYTNVGYAARANKKGLKPFKFYLHREILKPRKGFDTDHINGDRLDNRRYNLREATRAQNTQNFLKNKTNTSGYKGVTFHRGAQKFRATIQINKKQITLGHYNTAEEAAKVYNMFARHYYGEFARPNVIVVPQLS